MHYECLICQVKCPQLLIIGCDHPPPPPPDHTAIKQPLTTFQQKQVSALSRLLLKNKKKIVLNPDCLMCPVMFTCRPQVVHMPSTCCHVTSIYRSVMSTCRHVTSIYRSVMSRCRPVMSICHTVDMMVLIVRVVINRFYPINI